LIDDQIRQLQETGKIDIGDAQLVWRGKDEKDWSDLVVQTPADLRAGENSPQGDYRGPEAADEGPAGRRRDVRPVRGL